MSALGYFKKGKKNFASNLLKSRRFEGPYPYNVVTQSSIQTRAQSWDKKPRLEACLKELGIAAKGRLFLDGEQHQSWVLLEPS